MVGPNKDKFTVPKAFLTKSSDFFKACCDGEWKESKTKTIELPDASPDEFSMYLQWFYTDDLIVTEDEMDSAPRNLDERDQKLEQHFRPLFRLAIFADKYGDTAFANAVNDGLLRAICTYQLAPGFDYLKLAYSTLPAKSKTLEMLADRFAWEINPKNLKSNISAYPHAFFHQVWVSMSEKQQKGQAGRKTSTPSIARRCVYHEHNDKVPKTAKCTD